MAATESKVTNCRSVRILGFLGCRVQGLVEVFDSVFFLVFTLRLRGSYKGLLYKGTIRDAGLSSMYSCSIYFGLKVVPI